MRVRSAATIAIGTILACLASALPPSTALSATSDGRFAVERPGQALCSRFMRAKEANGTEYSRLLGFVEGYLSAANRYEPNTFDLTPWHNAQALSLILSKHCEDNPDEPLGVAVQKLVSAMLPLRLASHSNLQRIDSGDNHLEVYEVVMERAQQALASRGLYSGQVDGQYTPAMKSALEKFQRTAGLDPSGLPDTPTLWVLLNP